MDLVFTYSVFNLLIPTRCETSPYICIPTISPLSVSLIHMIVFPQVEVIFIHEYFHGGHWSPHALDTYTAAPPTGPLSLSYSSE